MDQPMEQEPPAIEGPRRTSEWVATFFAIVVVTVLSWLVVRHLSKRAAESHLLPVPDLSGRPAALVAQIREAVGWAQRRPDSGLAVGQLAKVYHANAFHDEARAAYELALHNDPEEFVWPYLLGVLEASEGQLDRPLVRLARAVELKPDYPHAWVRLGQLQWSSGAHEQAVRSFERALGLSPTHPHAVAGMARAWGRQDRWAEAITVLQSAVTHHPQISTLHRLLVQAYRRLGREEDAKGHEGRGSELQINDEIVNEVFYQSTTSKILVIHAGIAEAWWQFPWAERLLYRAVQTNPDDLDARVAVSDFLARRYPTDRGRLLEAKHLAEDAVQRHPESMTARHVYAAALYEFEELSDAEREWQRIYEAHPRHALALMGLGQIYFDQREFDKARQYFRLALDVPPDSVFGVRDRRLAYHQYALASWAAGRHDESLESFEQAARSGARLTIVPTQAMRIRDHARLLAHLERVEEALEVYREAIAAHPLDSGISVSFVNFLLSQARMAEARDRVDHLLTIRSADPRVLTAHGFLLLQDNDVDGAIEVFRAAVKRDENFAMAHYHLGRALVRKGLLDQAISHFEAAVSLKTSYAPAQAALDEARGQKLPANSETGAGREEKNPEFGSP